MSDYMNTKTENIQKFLDNCLKRQKDELIEAFLSKEQSIPLIAKIIEKETIEDYCSSEIIAELIYDKLIEKWEEI